MTRHVLRREPRDAPIGARVALLAAVLLVGGTGLVVACAPADTPTAPTWAPPAPAAAPAWCTGDCWSRTHPAPQLRRSVTADLRGHVGP